ncbi:hypothetical protein MYP_4519 [Sporocytophaga myxococcoides]|uniref:CAAX prenyl protease 2/Lysostaphin resistance protein A-like domain-containing protein n=2 Tax=Sporocytophaga myxococcoides TaxID=153721 RepID=A0A098LLD9_9BACT|nr:hypothetical protein MYP_4519 [Sporocytophaga myxococcoides]
MLINPAVLVLIATTIGTILYDKVNLSVPLFEKLFDKRGTSSFSLKGIIVEGIVLGVLAGIAILAVAYFFKPYLPQVLLDSSDNARLNLITKLLYGGVTEELLCRFGLMTLFVWVLYKIFKSLNAAVFWSANFLSAVLFAVGHLPMVFQLVTDVSFPVYAYVILGNSIGGLLFGYAYWKRGLESAFMAHAFTHLTMVGVNLVFS